MSISRTSVLLLFNLRKFRVNQFFISVTQLVREEGGRVDEGLVVRKSWVSTVEVNVTFVEDIAEGKEVDDEEEGSQDRTLGHP